LRLRPPDTYNWIATIARRLRVPNRSSRPGRRVYCWIISHPHFAALHWLVLATVFSSLFGPAPLSAADDAAGERIELEIPVENNQFSHNAAIAEINQKLGLNLPARESDRQFEIPRALRVYSGLSESGLLRQGAPEVHIEPDSLRVRFPNPEDDASRRARRRWIATYFGITVPDWPEGRGLHLPENFDARRRSVLLLHGLESNDEALGRLRQALSAAGLQVLTFDYPNDGPIAWSGERLQAELRDLARRHPQLRLVVVAHSMGGLVVRHALETPPGQPGPGQPITDVFFLGTPHQGSRLALMQPALELAFAGDERWKPHQDGGIGEAAMDLRPNSHFLRRLNAQPRPQGVRYFCGIGTVALFTEEEMQALRTRTATKPALQKLVGLIADSGELQTGRGDSCVSVESAKLPDIAGTREFELDHVQLLSSPAPVVAWILECCQPAP
jgi:pimeloyl-ACP methyl ester carboxylesterase